MASAVLTPDPQLFPIGTTVKVYAVPANAPSGWLPKGSALSEPEVATTGLLTVTGVTIGSSYVAEATLGGTRRTLFFDGGEAAGSAGLSEAEVIALIESHAGAALVSSVFGRTGAVVKKAGDYTASDVAADASGAAATAQSAAEAAAATAAAGKDATLKTEAEAKIATAKAAAVTEATAASRPAGAVVSRERETVSIPGTVANESLLVPMGIVSLGSGETQKAVKLQCKIQSGTKVTGKVRRKNGAGAIEDLTGFTAVEATTTLSSKTPTAVSLADGDELYFLIESAEGTPKGLAVTLDVDHSV